MREDLFRHDDSPWDGTGESTFDRSCTVPNGSLEGCKHYRLYAYIGPSGKTGSYTVDIAQRSANIPFAEVKGQGYLEHSGCPARDSNRRI